MIKAFTLLLLALSSCLALAGDWQEQCKSVAGAAEEVMRGHQLGFPVSSAMELAGDSTLFQDIVMEAYDLPRYRTAEMQDAATAEFRDKWYLECAKQMRK